MLNALLLFAPLTKEFVKENVYGDFIAKYRKKDQPVAIGCIVVFFITGFFLMLLNEHYMGIGDVFTNSWSIVLFVKHLLFLAMVGLGVYQGTRVMPNLAKAGK
jgi:putative copper export protein